MSKSFLNFITAFSASGRELESTCWRPATDVYRTSDGWLVKMELAGVSPQEIELRADRDSLLVSGMRRDIAVCEDCYSYSLEINYNRFQRRIDLPCDLATCHITTEYRDGMLLIWLSTSE